MPERRRDVTHFLDKTTRLRDSAEAIVLVEGYGCVVDGIDDDQPGASMLARCPGALHRIPQEFAAKATPAERLVESQACKKNRRDHIGTATADPFWHLRAGDEMRRQGEIGDDHRIARMPDKGPTGVHRIGVSGTAPQPVVQVRNTRGESFEIVRLGETLGDKIHARPLCLPDAARARRDPEKVGARLWRLVERGP